MMVRFWGITCIGHMNSVTSKLPRNHAATPAFAAVPGPAPNRGRIAAYNQTRNTPATKSRNTNQGICAFVMAGRLIDVMAAAI